MGIYNKIVKVSWGIIIVDNVTFIESTGVEHIVHFLDGETRLVSENEYKEIEAWLIAEAL